MCSPVSICLSNSRLHVHAFTPQPQRSDKWWAIIWFYCLIVRVLLISQQNCAFIFILLYFSGTRNWTQYPVLDRHCLCSWALFLASSSIFRSSLIIQYFTPMSNNGLLCSSLGKQSAFKIVSLSVFEISDNWSTKKTLNANPTVEISWSFHSEPLNLSSFTAVYLNIASHGIRP